MAGFDIVGTKNHVVKGRPNICDPHFNHRWRIEQLLGNDDAMGVFAYAKDVIIPDYTPGSSPTGCLVLNFYDISGSVWDNHDILENLIEISKCIGNTRISRTSYDGRIVGEWEFTDCHTVKLIMPKTDYTSSDLSIVTLHVTYKAGYYHTKNQRSRRVTNSPDSGKRI